MNNNWDKLAKKFTVPTDSTDIDADVADNVLTAWPPIIELILKISLRPITRRTAF